MYSMTYRCFRILLLVLNAVLFVMTLGVNTYGSLSGIFNENAVGNRNRYDMDITPAPWTFGVIWSIIYLFQLAIITYSIVNIWRSTPGGFLYFTPDIIPVSFLLPYMGNWFFNSSWIFIAMRAQFDITYLPVMTVCLWLIFLTLVMSLVSSYKALALEKNALKKFGLGGDIIAVIVLLQNGISIYATWGAVASSLQVGQCLVYIGNLTQELAGTITFTIVAALLVIYVSLDVFALDRFTRYVFAPHCTLIIALSGCVSRMGISHDLNSIFALVLLVLCSALLIAKIVVSIIRSVHEKQPVFPVNGPRISCYEDRLPIQ